jgi:Recombinase zinc beta ribbon domain
VTKAKGGHEDYRKHTCVLRSFLKCGVCGLRMHGNVRRGRKGAYYTCALNRRQSSLVPEDHPRAVYLREDKAGEKVVEFLTTRVFGPERIEALRASLAEIGPEATISRVDMSDSPGTGAHRRCYDASGNGWDEPARCGSRGAPFA